MTEFLGLLPFERSSGASPLPVQGVGEDGVGLSVIGIRLDGCLKLEESFSYLTPLEKGLTRIECEVGALAADSYSAKVGGRFAFCRRACGSRIISASTVFARVFDRCCAVRRSVRCSISPPRCPSTDARSRPLASPDRSPLRLRRRPPDPARGD